MALTLAALDGSGGRTTCPAAPSRPLIRLCDPSLWRARTARGAGARSISTRDPSEPVQCFGPEASARAQRLLPPGRHVRLETDDTQDTRDRYGRLLANVFTPGTAGPGGSVNHRMVRGGYARVYVYGGVRFRYADAFFRAQHRARSAGLGLWGAPCLGRTERRAAPAGAGSDPNHAGACVPLSSSDPILSGAVRWELLSSSPAAGVQPPRRPARGGHSLLHRGRAGPGGLRAALPPRLRPGRLRRPAPRRAAGPALR
jgi:hypothetical protein